MIRPEFNYLERISSVATENSKSGELPITLLYSYERSLYFPDHSSADGLLKGFFVVVLTCASNALYWQLWHTTRWSFSLQLSSAQRIWGLQPGEYLICILSRCTWGSASPSWQQQEQQLYLLLVEQLRFCCSQAWLMRHGIHLKYISQK